VASSHLAAARSGQDARFGAGGELPEKRARSAAAAVNPVADAMSFVALSPGMMKRRP
jgi:hypothetical protein